MASMIDHMSEQMESLQQMFTQSDVSRSLLEEKLSRLADAVGALADKVDTGGTTTQALERVADGQDKLVTYFEGQGPGDGIDAESRMRLRSIDVQMLRILEEISAGRQESMTELRGDLNALIKVVQGERNAPRKLRAKTGPEE